MIWDTVTIVGVGLLGGSVGRSIKARQVARRVLGAGRDAEFLELAVQLGAIDDFTTDLGEGFAVADLVVAATPVDALPRVILDGALRARPGTIITDVGSTKENLCEALAGKLPGDVHFVGSHPLAGSEKAGVEHAREEMFDGKTVVVVPGPSDDAAGRVEQFWQSLGARTVRMSAAEHDRAIAMTSHLPHALAASLARVLPPEWLPLAASGFRDTTRVAAGEPDLWKAIVFDNKDNVLAAVKTCRRSLEEFESLLNDGDGAGLLRWLDEGKQVRDALGD